MHELKKEKHFKYRFPCSSSRPYILARFPRPGSGADR